MADAKPRKSGTGPPLPARNREEPMVDRTAHRGGTHALALIVSVLVAVSGLALALAASAQPGSRNYRIEVQNAEAALKRETPRLYDPADRNSLSLRIDQLKEMA